MMADQRHHDLCERAVSDARHWFGLDLYRELDTIDTEYRGRLHGRSYFDYPKNGQGNRIRAVGNAGRNTIQQPGLKQLGHEPVQELYGHRKVSRAVPVGVVQHL